MLNFIFFANNEDFEFIFGIDHHILFTAYNWNMSGNVDVLEIFCALILFSDSLLKDKIWFLFEIFDLNDKHYLQKDELEFLFYKCFNSLYKVFNINKELD